MCQTKLACVRLWSGHDGQTVFWPVFSRFSAFSAVRPRWPMLASCCKFAIVVQVLRVTDRERWFRAVHAVCWCQAAPAGCTPRWSVGRLTDAPAERLLHLANVRQHARSWVHGVTILPGTGVNSHQTTRSSLPNWHARVWQIALEEIFHIRLQEWCSLIIKKNQQHLDHWTWVYTIKH